MLWESWRKINWFIPKASRSAWRRLWSMEYLMSSHTQNQLKFPHFWKKTFTNNEQSWFFQQRTRKVGEEQRWKWFGFQNQNSRHFPSSFYFSYTTLIPKGISRTPLSLRPITVLPVPYRIYASLRCQTLLTWQNSWIHPSEFAFCKGRSTTSLNSHLSFGLLNRFQTHGAFAGVQFDFAKCFDSIPYKVIWDTLKYHGCDPNLTILLQGLYTNMKRCFRYAGCVGPFWRATNGLLQGDPLSVVILNCVLCPLLRQLASIPDLTVYAFADDLAIVSSSWDTLNQAYQLLRLFCANTDLVLNVSKCQLWNKGSPHGTYPLDFDQFAFCFYPFLLGSPIDIGVPYSDSHQQHDETILTRARKIAKLSLPYRVIYRLFVSLVSSCYIITMHSLVTWPPRKVTPSNMLLLPSWFPNVANGSVEKPFIHLPPQGTCYPHNFFWTTGILLNIFSTSAKQPLPIGITCLPFGLKLCTLDGDPSFDYEKLQKVFHSLLRTHLFFLSIMKHTLFMNLWTLLNIWYGIHTVKLFSHKLLNAGKTVKVKHIPYILNLPDPSISHLLNHYTNLSFDKYLLVQLTIIVQSY